MDLHIHSKYSHDSLSEPSKIIKVARKRGLDIISITDHNSMAVYKHIPQSGDIVIVPGMEIKTDMGDIIGFFLQDEIKSRSFWDVADEIRGQDGFVALPHPFRRQCDPQEFCSSVDLIEVINSRSNDFENQQAWNLCEISGKIPITGSDAHSYFEIGMAMTEIDGIADSLDGVRQLLLNKNRRCFGRCTPYYFAHGYSFVISKIKNLVK